MTAWSPSEAIRTIDEAKRRSLIEPEFRALLLSDPITAVAKINPRPIPAESLRFVESKDAALAATQTGIMIVVLPDPGTSLEDVEELTEEDLTSVAGGGQPPPPPPIDLS